jgi:membrane protease YdiL (CAAX protease family)
MHSLLGPRLEFDRRVATATIVSTLLLLLDHYHQFSAYKHLDRIVLYLLVPIAIIVAIWREHPRDYGFTVGEWKAGLLLTGTAALLAGPAVWWLGTLNPGMRAYYSGPGMATPWASFLDLVGWEFLFRGWLLFTYAPVFGANALWLQAVPFALAHAGKPGLEAFSTIFGGFAFGWLAHRTRSFVWPFLLHWFIGTLVIMASTQSVP